MLDPGFRRGRFGSFTQDPYSYLGAYTSDNPHGRGVRPHELHSSQAPLRAAYDPPVALRPSQPRINNTSPIKRRDEFALDQSSKDPFQRILGQNAKLSPTTPLDTSPFDGSLDDSLLYESPMVQKQLRNRKPLPSILENPTKPAPNASSSALDQPATQFSPANNAPGGSLHDTPLKSYTASPRMPGSLPDDNDDYNDDDFFDDDENGGYVYANGFPIEQLNDEPLIPQWVKDGVEFAISGIVAFARFVIHAVSQVFNLVKTGAAAISARITPVVSKTRDEHIPLRESVLAPVPPPPPSPQAKPAEPAEPFLGAPQTRAQERIDLEKQHDREAPVFQRRQSIPPSRIQKAPSRQLASPMRAPIGLNGQQSHVLGRSIGPGRGRLRNGWTGRTPSQAGKVNQMILPWLSEDLKSQLSSTMVSGAASTKEGDLTKADTLSPRPLKEIPVRDMLLSPVPSPRTSAFSKPERIIVQATENLKVSENEDEDSPRSYSGFINPSSLTTPMKRAVHWFQSTSPLGRPISSKVIYDQFARIWEPEEPEGPSIKPISAAWKERVCMAMRMPDSQRLATSIGGDPITRRDLMTCFLPYSWLNDEIINSYLGLLVDYARKKANNMGLNARPKFHAFNSFFYSNLRDRGYQSVRRWARRAKIDGADSLLDMETILIPVHGSAHWTLAVIHPRARTIEHYDSIGSLSPRTAALAKEWLKGELQSAYKDEEWQVLPSVSPQQDNGSDCGVFLLTTAKLVILGRRVEYSAADMPDIRLRIVAELLNGSLDGDFEEHSGLSRPVKSVL